MTVTNIPIDLVMDEETVAAFEELIEDTPFNLEHLYIRELPTGNILFIKVDNYYSALLFDLSTEYFKTVLPYHVQHHNYIYKALTNKNWNKLFTLIDSRTKLAAYQDYKDQIPIETRLDIFKMVYQNSNYDFNELDESIFFELQSYHANEISKVNELTVYRGVGSKSEHIGYSWTTDIEIARRFAIRWDNEGVILTCKVKPEQIAALYLDSLEKEVLLIPSLIKDYVTEFSSVMMEND